MPFHETAPARKRSPQLGDEAEPRTAASERAFDGAGPIDAGPLVLPDPFASAFAEDPFPPGTGAHHTQPGAPGRTVFERYQKLFAAAENARDHESAILAALDFAILGARQPGVAGHTKEPLAGEAAPHRPRLRSFHFERDLDWSEEPPPVLDSARAPLPDAEASKPRESASSFAPPPLDSEAPVMFDDAAPKTEHAEAAKAPSRTGLSRKWTASSFGTWLAAALLLGFGLGFVLGRGDDAPRAVSSVASAPSAQPTPAAATELERTPELGPTHEVPSREEPSRAPEPAPSLAQPNGASALLSSAQGEGQGAENQRPAESPAPPSARNTKLATEASGFDMKGALLLLGKAGARAGVCVPPGEPGGTVLATVTFGKRGYVEEVALSNPTFSGNYSSDCIKGVLSSVRVRPFFGAPVSVKKTVTVR